ncbi:hypothetical protein B0J11DRAFT_430471 [Dendryphion nanum]|uniref:Hemerythrin-like domain-containing protein n=1 Tax=Dendryphion nanum TaxID=256645 RepID=A0A9P9IPR8_9PLEO|nr:hypothetical protein B0J11DRAFT_430471 [Dendryphion nanum]
MGEQQPETAQLASAETAPPAPEPAKPASAALCEEKEKPLPKLSATEFRIYNRMAEHMDYFHNNFRSTWTMLITTCTNNKRPAGMSINQFLSSISQLIHHLTMHHTIEEQHIFPVLAKKMPAFRKELELLSQHREIHKGLDRLEEYVEACRSGERELRLGELKGILDGFGDVLWQHLDDEVKQLGAENMRRFWSVEEMRRMPM